jgi:hypothetical protein
VSRGAINLRDQRHATYSIARNGVETLERGLAPFQRLSPQIRTVELEQIETEDSAPRRHVVASAAG